MNNPDCGNQVTGQPRCVQFMANTWNWPSPRLHSVNASERGHAVRQRIGLLNVSNRSRPAETSSRVKRLPHGSFLRSGPRKCHPTSGTAVIVAASAPMHTGEPLERKFFLVDVDGGDSCGTRRSSKRRSQRFVSAENVRNAFLDLNPFSRSRSRNIRLRRATQPRKLAFCVTARSKRHLKRWVFAVQFRPRLRLWPLGDRHQQTWL